MATLPDQLTRAAEALRQAGPRLAALKAQTILALVTLRVQNQGLTGKLYSSALIPTFYFGRQALNAGGRAYIKKNRLGTWAGLRASEGLPVDAVNLTHSGRMFRSLAIAPGANQGAVFFAEIVAADQEGASKVRYNIRRYGNFLLPLPSEEAEASAAVVAEIQRLIKQVFDS